MKNVVAQARVGLLGHILCYGYRKIRTCTGAAGERKEPVVGKWFWYGRCQGETKETY